MINGCLDTAVYTSYIYCCNITCIYMILLNNVLPAAGCGSQQQQLQQLLPGRLCTSKYSSNASVFFTLLFENNRVQQYSAAGSLWRRRKASAPYYNIV